MAAEKIEEKGSTTLHLPSAGMVSSNNDEQGDHGPGLYAVPVLPFMSMPGFPAGNLIPLTYRIPTRSDPAGPVNEETIQEAQQHGQQRQQVVERRLQFAFQIDLILILKLAAVVFLFNQEGSRHRFIVLTLFALLIYLYQTGAFAPILRWLRRAAAPPPPQVARPENAPLVVQNQANDQPTEGIPAAENQTQPAEDGGPVENEDGGRGNGVAWWGIVREIKLIVVGFIASLFPGFHHHND
ncbi:hypothetical protein Taro_050586 [Colocasia esculenta]|uniref:Uncharacterized protein n=1 Tax=Colocasia esculenta TaxID=4460 RepID=A0A843XDT9_COLES|nr:hypothetical protein [Colocasia esculenta]